LYRNTNGTYIPVVGINTPNDSRGHIYESSIIMHTKIKMAENDYEQIDIHPCDG
jgi:hypothetical protein